jgi:hypothetical protein
MINTPSLRINTPSMRINTPFRHNDTSPEEGLCALGDEVVPVDRITNTCVV